LGVDVAVEIKAALLDQAQRRHRRDGLGQRRGLVERAGRGAGPMGACPGQLAALDERDAHRRDVEHLERLTKADVLRGGDTTVRTDDLQAALDLGRVGTGTALRGGLGRRRGADRQSGYGPGSGSDE